MKCITAKEAEEEGHEEHARISGKAKGTAKARSR